LSPSTAPSPRRLGRLVLRLWVHAPRKIKVLSRVLAKIRAGRQLESRRDHPMRRTSVLEGQYRPSASKRRPRTPLLPVVVEQETPGLERSLQWPNSPRDQSSGLLASATARRSHLPVSDMRFSLLIVTRLVRAQ
jgi:hypothetical protein